MNHAELMAFITKGIERWDRIRKDFSNNKEMSAFLKKSYPVVMFDHYQLDIDLAKNLYKPVYTDDKKATMEDRKREEFRQKMVLHLKNYLKELSLTIRFPHLDIGLIQELKAHPEIKDLNSSSKANIRVVVSYLKLRNGEQEGHPLTPQ